MADDHDLLLGLIGIIVISDIGISVGIENYVASSFIASHI